MWGFRGKGIVPATEIQQQIGRITSISYGEMIYNRKSNLMLISDFTSSLYRNIPQLNNVITSLFETKLHRIFITFREYRLKLRQALLLMFYIETGQPFVTMIISS